MTAFRTLPGIDQAASLPGPLHLAIGMFDGVHLGHQSVIEAAVHTAARAGGTAAVLSFWPHPSALVSPERRTRMILGPEAKRAVIAGLGVAALIEQPFTEEFARGSAEEFLPRLKAALPKLAAVYVGENWRFGAGRTGDIALLLRSAAALGVTVFSAPRVHLNGEPISSSRIRAALVAGDITQVNTLLGYPYFAEGCTVRGAQLGRTLGFPTLNLPWDPDLRPAFGVYAVRVASAASLAEGSPVWCPGVANYGIRPTVGGTRDPLLEIHVLGECPFGYGDRIEVEWLRFQRAEQRFPDVQALREQIEKDVAAISSDFRLQGSP